jgi:hypothetical protein
MMLISRGHYTVDIVIAYYVATRLFWIYHTLANNPQLKVIYYQFIIIIFEYLYVCVLLLIHFLNELSAAEWPKRVVK